MTLIITGTCNCPHLEHQVSDKEFNDLKLKPCPLCKANIFWKYD